MSGKLPKILRDKPKDQREVIATMRGWEAVNLDGSTELLISSRNLKILAMQFGVYDDQTDLDDEPDDLEVQTEDIDGESTGEKSEDAIDGIIEQTGDIDDEFKDEESGPGEEPEGGESTGEQGTDEEPEGGESTGEQGTDEEPDTPPLLTLDSLKEKSWADLCKLAKENEVKVTNKEKIISELVELFGLSE